MTVSTSLPAKVERVWLVDATGSTVERQSAPKKLSTGQRHLLYRMGLRVVDEFMKARGFTSNAEESQCGLSYEKRGVWIDLKIKRPDNIAFVTSYSGYEYSADKVKAKVITAKDMLGSDFLVQINVSTNDAAGTRAPIFVPLPKELEKPAQYVVQNVLGTLAEACRTIPKVKDAFTADAVREAQTKPIEELPVHDLPLLPD